MKVTILVPKEVDINIDLPKPGEEVSLSRVVEICRHFGLDDLADQIVADTPKKPFVSDGCSMFPDEMFDTCHYLACFIHDVFYWAGREEDEVGRLHADLILASTVSSLHGGTSLAELMLAGVRVGGNVSSVLPWCWGYGR